MRLSAPSFVWLCVVMWMLGCGGSTPAAVSVPPPPEPPKDALAWMPADSALVARAELAPFRGTPLWALWTDFQKKRKQLQFWIDNDLVDEVTLSASQLDQPQPSFVAAVRGRFGEGYLDGLALKEQLPSETLGLVRGFKRPEAVWVQVTADLIVACSHDRAPWLATRSEAGPGVAVRETALFQSLAERTAFSTAHLVALIEDPEGKGKARLEKDSERLGVGLPDDVIDEIKRAGVSVVMGPEISLSVQAEAASVEGAESIRSTATRSLDALASNMFVGMFGLRPIIKAIRAETQGNYVSVRAKYQDSELYGLIDKLKTVLGMAMSRNAATSEP